jgi:hypothetical protein
MNPLFKDLLSVLLPAAIVAYALLIRTDERSKRSREDENDLKSNVAEFVKEFRNCISILNVTSERQAVLQKVTNDTMLSLITKLETLEHRVNVHDTQIAIINKD